ncbi:hypothetical protein M3090_01540 [Bacteroides sp. ET71]|uniref:hypothetical protein n=1 Tax=Bacteroides sp. ET71 TaxID=2939421 RepID=UPI0020139598|nr:hypothetical protein [Bacteroides sp. ET71]MCL1615094.1 hypothetical protein [Bacteroides sp. ET71]
MNFKTPISTTREQSERMLALGLKPETADCYIECAPSGKDFTYIRQPYNEDIFKRNNIIPSWSLARLLEMMPQYIDKREEVLLMIEPPLIVYYDTRYKGQQHFTTYPDIFDNCISMIDWLIRNGHFKKEYLIENP